MTSYLSTRLLSSFPRAARGTNTIHPFSVAASKQQPPKLQVGATTLQQLEEYKAQQKERRTQLHQAKVHRITSTLPNRRNIDKKYFLRNTFRAYFQKMEANHSFWEREAKRLQLPWNIKVGVMLERLPVVTPAVPDWEEDYLTLSDYLGGKTHKIYPKELGFADPTEYTAPTLEEIYGAFSSSFLFKDAVFQNWFLLNFILLLLRNKIRPGAKPDKAKQRGFFSCNTV